MVLKVIFCFVALAVTVDGKLFSLSRDGVDCILMNVNAVFQVEVEQNGTRDNPVAIDLEQLNTTVGGSCPNGTSASTASLIIDIEDFASWTLVFSLTTRNTTALHQLFQFNATKALNNSNLPNVIVIEDVPIDLELSSPEASYECNATENFNFTSNSTGSDTFYVTQTISSLRVQAFNVANNSFSEPEHCEQDGVTTEVPNTSTVEPTNSSTGEPTNSSTGEPTTPTPSVTPPPIPSSANTYIVNGTNATCIVLKGIIVFNNISYEKMEGNETTRVSQSVPVPLRNTTGDNVNVTGDCFYNNGTEQLLSIAFYGNWTLSMVFARLSDSEYGVKEVVLRYYLDSTIFPGAGTNSGQNRTAENLNITNGFLKGSISGSYKCDAQLMEELSDGVSMETSDLQVKAFNKDFNTDFNSDSVTECEGDSKSNSIVPIVVGASLAGLVVIVLIAYLIGRRRSRRTGYESV